MLDFSHRRELSLHAEVAADVASALNAKGIAGAVVGAFARDLHLHYRAGVPVQRETEDIDFALLVSSWNEFHSLREQLLRAGAFRAVVGAQHRLKHRTDFTVDLVPSGTIEADDRRISWPPDGDVVMDVFGFREALATTDVVRLPGNVAIRVVSLPALGLLKIIAWNDRRLRTPRKDAADLSLIIRHYLAIPENQQRLWSEFTPWTELPGFDFERSGARMLGYDIRRLVDDKGLERINAILRPQLDESDIGGLPQEMDPRSPQRAYGLLRSLHGELA